MGNCSSASSDGSGRAPADTTHEVLVKTGDKKGAETDGNIFFSVGCEDGSYTDELKMDTKWKNDFERGNTDRFYLSFPCVRKVTEICIRRDGTGKNDAWFLEKVVVIHTASKDQSIFPVNRWILADDKICISEYDTSLPFEDKHPEQRAAELDRKRSLYKLKETVAGAPMQIEDLPDDERFSNDYQWDIQATKLKLFAQTKYIDLTTSDFTSLKDFEKIYRDKGLLPTPYGAHNWRSDAEFGNQRLAGCAPNMFKLCESIPEKFAVTAEMVEPFLEGKSLEDAMKSKKIYIMDLTYLASIKCTADRKLPGPYGLFYAQDGGEFVPIAIQLMPEPADNNPVFLPSDPEYTWLAVKMWFNLADASHHQSVTHLGFTHLVIETVAVCTHRQLSPSHPIFKLLAPHFIYLLAINTLAVNKLVSPGGWVDICMQIGRDGMFNIIKANWAEWNVNEHGNFPKELERRGVSDTKALEYYPYRDDGLLLWNAIHKYVTAVVDVYYDSPQKLSDDSEIQAFAKQLIETNIAGIPEQFKANQELADTITSFIFIASVGHAAANFAQYDEYAFPPNYPAMLTTDIPKDKTPLTEEYIVKSLATKDQTLSVMLVTKILSQRGTKSLGDFELQYAYDTKAMKALEQFREDLKEIEGIIDKRNATRDKKYIYLNPREVPNAISI